MPALQVQLHNSGAIPLEATFDCQPGELVALVGPSGSGKTSVLRAVAGLLKGAHVRGSVRVGQDAWFDSDRGIDWSPQARRAGLVFQSYALFPHLNAMENVAIGAASTGAGSQYNAQIKALFERLGLAGLERRLPAQLSGGQQQRVALARALMRIQMPQRTGQNTAAKGVAGQGVLLLDEPFSAVDAPTRQTLYRELAALRQHVSTPMVLVTHDLLEARRLADRVVILDAGTTLQNGTPAKVFSQPRNARVAQLVGIQNLFKGRFHQTQTGWGALHWSGHPADPQAQTLVLHTVDKSRIDDGVEVGWVLAGESMEVMPWPTAVPASGNVPVAEPVNMLDCNLREVLELGETSLCTLVPNNLPSERLTLTLSTAHLRAMGVGSGSRLAVRFAPQAIHIMPLRT
jgi:molybdate transport system ATP-binding protein